MRGYVTSVEIAKRWNVSVRQIQLLCQNGKIKDASRFGNSWVIPEDTLKLSSAQVNRSPDASRKTKRRRSSHERTESKGI